MERNTEGEGASPASRQAARREEIADPIYDAYERGQNFLGIVALIVILIIGALWVALLALSVR